MKKIDHSLNLIGNLNRFSNYEIQSHRDNFFLLENYIEFRKTSPCMVLLWVWYCQKDKWSDDLGWVM